MDGAGKKLWGYDKTNDVWVPLQSDANGLVKVDMSAVNLDDLGDVSVPTPTNGYILYWDAATSLWKCKAAPGGGDMYKAVYDPNADGIIALAQLDPLVCSEAEADGKVAAEAAARNAAIAAVKLDDLADVSVPTPTNGYFLYWDAATSLWKCKAVGAVAGSKIADADGDTKVDTEASADEDKVRMNVAGVEAFLLDNAGILDLVKQSAARIRLATTQSLPSGVWSIAKLDTVDFDQQTEFNLVNWRYYPKKSGKYLIAAGALFVAAQVVADIPYGVAIFKGLSPQAQTIAHMPDNTSDLAMSTTDIEQINAGQYIRLMVYQNTGVNKDLCASTATFLAVCKVA